MINKVFSILIAFSAIIFRGNVKKGEIVQTKSGLVQGIVSHSRDGREFYEWLGIPYAKPPIGELRFASPQAVDEWEGVKETSSYSEKCAQLELLTNNVIGNEDCLYLNVHRPKLIDWETKNLPVIVYIHGGGYNWMGSNDYRPDYFMDEDVVLVVMNYRLAIFGFLSTGDAVIRGNMGLRDQILALKWVKENIKSFGGDPNQITMAGESAGAGSVHMHLLTPTTKGLFKKAIAHSGVATCPWNAQTTAEAKAITVEFSNTANCPWKESSQLLLECLRNKSTRELLEAYLPQMQRNSMYKPYLKGEIVQPCIEGVNDSETILAEHPLKIVEEGRAQRIPWMLGVVASEGLVIEIEFIKDPELMKLFESDFNDLTLNIFGIPREMPGAQEIADKIRKFYFPPNVTTEEAKLDQYGKMFGDALFYVHVNNVASTQRKFSPTNLIHFNRGGGPTVTNLLLAIREGWPMIPQVLFYLVKTWANRVLFGIQPRNYGVSHFDDMAYLFRVPNMYDIPRDGSDLYKFSKDMVKLWVSFAKDENLEFRGLSIPFVEKTGPLKYFELNEVPHVIKDPFEDRMSFLKSLDFLKYAM